MWNPDQWAKIFKDAGAKYVVLTAKHHDSFCLWPTRYKNPNRDDSVQHSKRDIVGELTMAVRRVGMNMGLYYSGGIDWSFTHSFEPSVNDNLAYQELAYRHLQELIQRYRPSVLWDDINWPGPNSQSKAVRLRWLFAEYFNLYCPQGVVNDRWKLEGKFKGDFITHEYEVQDVVSHDYFELCRGIGYSFGFNAEETLTDYMSPADAIWLLADVVARGGNLLLNVGPAASGAIAEGQMKVLSGLADWMKINAEAIFNTKPYLEPGARVNQKFQDGLQVRFTRKEKGRAVYAIVRTTLPANHIISFQGFRKLMDAHANARLLLLDSSRPLIFEGGVWHVPKDIVMSDMPFVVRFFG